MSSPALAAPLRCTYITTGPSLAGGSAGSEAVVVSNNCATELVLPDLLRAVLCHSVFARWGAAVGTDALKTVFNPCSDDNVLAGGSNVQPPKPTFLLSGTPK